MELKRIGPTGILGLDCRNVSPLTSWHLNAQALDLATVLNVLTIEELQTRDHDRSGRMVVDIDNVSITADAHFRSALDRLVRGRDENRNTITGACACEHAGNREACSVDDVSHVRSRRLTNRA